MFDDDMNPMSGHCLSDGLKKEYDIKEEPKSGKASPRSPIVKDDSLFTVEGLQPHMNDLNKLFDSPGEDVSS